VDVVVVLDGAHPVDDPLARHELEAAVTELLIPRVRHMLALEAEGAGEELGHGRNDVPPRLDELDVLDGPRRARVTEVGEQPHPPRLDRERGVRADESGQVPDVRLAGDDQRLLELLDEFLDSGVHLFLARYASASRYPSGPLPMIRFATTSEITDLRRHSSRSSMFER